MTHLTPFDTGARAEPTVWAPVPPGAAYGDIVEGKHDDRYGRVDFENDSSEHVVTVHVERDADGEYVLVTSQPIRVRIESENIVTPPITFDVEETHKWQPWRVRTTCAETIVFAAQQYPDLVDITPAAPAEDAGPWAGATWYRSSYVNGKWHLIDHARSTPTMLAAVGCSAMIGVAAEGTHMRPVTSDERHANECKRCSAAANRESEDG